MSHKTLSCSICPFGKIFHVGNPNASEEEIINAARAAQCEEFITELENGYDTIVGDAGAKLSGGNGRG